MRVRRPLLPQDDRARLRRMADAAEGRASDEQSTTRAYARGVADVLHWLDGEEQTRLLEEVTQ